MATCCGFQHNTPGSSVSPANFWKGLAIALSLWLVMVGALMIA